MIHGNVKVESPDVLRALRKTLSNKTFRIALNKASSPVKAAVVSNAPTRFGYLKKSIRIKVRNYKTSQTWVSIIGPKSDFIRKKGKRKSGPRTGEAYIHKPSKYARLVERGTSYAQPHPFLAPALDQTRSQFKTILSTAIVEQFRASAS